MTRRDARKTTQRKSAWYGWIPDLPDQRDRLYGAVYNHPIQGVDVGRL
jgi:hypothetical protein